MKFGHYYETTAKSLKEFNRKGGGGYCSNCHRDNTVFAVYLGYILRDSSYYKARGYQWQCSVCGCSFGEPFKIYFDDPNADD